jgi:hypothetical protein
MGHFFKISGHHIGVERFFSMINFWISENNHVRAITKCHYSWQFPNVTRYVHLFRKKMQHLASERLREPEEVAFFCRGLGQSPNLY